jgi:hypothetical protein
LRRARYRRERRITTPRTAQARAARRRAAAARRRAAAARRRAAAARRRAAAAVRAGLGPAPRRGGSARQTQTNSNMLTRGRGLARCGRMEALRAELREVKALLTAKTLVLAR